MRDSSHLLPSLLERAWSRKSREKAHAIGWSYEKPELLTLVRDRGLIGWCGTPGLHSQLEAVRVVDPSGVPDTVSFHLSPLPCSRPISTWPGVELLALLTRFLPGPWRPPGETRHYPVPIAFHGFAVRGRRCIGCPGAPNRHQDAEHFISQGFVCTV